MHAADALRVPRALRDAAPGKTSKKNARVRPTRDETLHLNARRRSGAWPGAGSSPLHSPETAVGRLRHRSRLGWRRGAGADVQSLGVQEGANKARLPATSQAGRVRCCCARDAVSSFASVRSPLLPQAVANVRSYALDPALLLKLLSRITRQELRNKRRKIPESEYTDSPDGFK